jgi:hypothetical protein
VLPWASGFYSFRALGGCHFRTNAIAEGSTIFDNDFSLFSGFPINNFSN